MTYKNLNEIIRKNNIPEDVEIYSNSGWECGATPVEGIYYSPSKNEIHLVYGQEHGEYVEDSLKKYEERAHDWIFISCSLDKNFI
jgi:hypothetical protein